MKKALLLSCAMSLVSAAACSDGKNENTSSRDGGLELDAAASGANASAADASAADAAKTLEGAGFTVQEGTFAFFDIQNCRNTPSCFGNNPTSPYGVYNLPPSPGQTVKEERVREDGLSPAFRLRQDEAIVFIGKTPPKSAYFSFRSYVFDRASENSNRSPLFASLGDSLNHEVIRTASGEAFDRETIVITSANEEVEQKVRSALVRAGIKESSINSDVIPASLVKLGLEKAADTFTMLFRVALFESEAAREAYVTAPRARVYRLTPTSSIAEKPFAVPSLRPNAPSPTEAALASSLDALEAAVRKAEGLTLAPSLPVQFRNLNGFDCLKDNSNCLGDNHDTTYAAALVGRITNDQTLYVLGVNHAATGKATYANVSVYAVDKLLGVAAVDDRQFRGTANEYLPEDPNADKLFVWKIARDCKGDDACSEVPFEFPGLDENALAAIGFRAYLEPGQHTSPSPDTLLVERVKERVLAFEGAPALRELPRKGSHWALSWGVSSELRGRGALRSEASRLATTLWSIPFGMSDGRRVKSVSTSAPPTLRSSVGTSAR